mmetsp:Transcript_1856/g.4693  ORF Transcript_1856/g.4693 Transcript_1856/m.4693 type:complete len:152 (+) Transcript_1856:188-643(+)
MVKPPSLKVSGSHATNKHSFQGLDCRCKCQTTAWTQQAATQVYSIATARAWFPASSNVGSHCMNPAVVMATPTMNTTWKMKLLSIHRLKLGPTASYAAEPRHITQPTMATPSPGGRDLAQTGLQRYASTVSESGPTKSKQNEKLKKNAAQS